MRVIKTLFYMLLLSGALVGGLEAKRIYDSYTEMKHKLESIEQKYAEAEQTIQSLQMQKSVLVQKLKQAEARRDSFTQGVKSLYK